MPPTQPDTANVQVLVVGAGPTGLLLAIYLVTRGVRVRIIDKAAEPGTTSRALVVHARTLELYRQLGLADAVVQSGMPFRAANLWARGKRVGHLQFGDMGRGLSPFPYMVIYPQDDHERMLIERLSRLGVNVERDTELVSLATEKDGVRSVLRRGRRDEECWALYVAGCDGAHSRVRASLGVGFPGGTYEHVFYVADANATGPVMDGQLHVVLDDADFLAVFPLNGAGRLRLIGTVKDELAAKVDLAWNDVSMRAIDRMHISVSTVHWFSTYHVHHRVADRFRVGRVFLLGDAAHIHSPVGGQGMNTGLGDAMNLAWKLVSVVAGEADDRLLATYEPERLAFARKLVGTTDRAFVFVTRSGNLARYVRLHVIPTVLPALVKLPMLKRFMFRTVSQIAIHYRGSALSRGRVGPLQGGDRLPWVQPESERIRDDNFTPLTSLDWQVHVYGAASATAREACRQHDLPLHEFPWNARARRAGLRRNASYLIRPDGYVAVAAPAGRSAELSAFLNEWRIRS